MSHPSDFKVSFTGFAVSNGALSCNKITLPCLLAHSSHLSINAWSRRASRVHNTQLWSHQIQNMVFLPKRFGLGVEKPATSSTIFPLRDFKVNPFFIIHPNSIQK
ncbi:hypothetical protein TNCV_2006491 [Trichonephila clavipes]|nr:hypothetical protein TNCV_2006491 [Trichonephila clavipes]